MLPGATQAQISKMLQYWGRGSGGTVSGSSLRQGALSTLDSALQWIGSNLTRVKLSWALSRDLGISKGVFKVQNCQTQVKSQ